MTISLHLFRVWLCALLALPVIAAAQTEAPPTSIEGAVGEVELSVPNLTDVAILKQEDEEIVLIFNLYSPAGVQPGLVYGVELYDVSEGGRVLVDSYAYRETPVTLDAKELLPISVTYNAPAVLSGTYELWVVLENQAGMRVAFNTAGNITFSGTPGVALEECALGASKGRVQVDGGEVMTIDCVVSNNTARELTLLPTATVYENSLFGSEVDAEIDVEAVTLAAGEQMPVSMTLSASTEPGDYQVAVTMFDETGQSAALEQVLEYQVAGELGEIRNVVLDQSAYEAGDIAALEVYWLAGQAVFAGKAAAEMSATLTSGGKACAEPAAATVSQRDLLTHLQFTVTKLCVAPQVAVTLRGADGAVVATEDYVFSPDKVTVYQPPRQWHVVPSVTAVGGQGLVVAFVLLLFLVSALIVLIYNRRAGGVNVELEEEEVANPDQDIVEAENDEDNNDGQVGGSGVTTAAVLFVLVLGGAILAPYSAHAYAVTGRVGYDNSVVEITYNTDKSSYDIGETVTFSLASNIEVGPGAEWQYVYEYFAVEVANGVYQQLLDVAHTDTTPGVYALGATSTTHVGFSTPGLHAFYKQLDVWWEYTTPPSWDPTFTGTVYEGLVTSGAAKVYFDCPAGTVWNSDDALCEPDIVPAPSGSVTGTGCAIPSGDYCSSDFTWSTSDVPTSTTVTLRNVTTNTQYSTNAAGTNEPFPLEYGNNTIILQVGTTTVDTIVLEAGCDAGSVYTGSVCTPSIATAAIGGNDCEISNGLNTCSAEFSWQVTDAVSPDVYNMTTGDLYVIISTGNATEPSSWHDVYYGDNIVAVRDGLVAVATTSVTATCASTASWNPVTSLCETAEVNKYLSVCDGTTLLGSDGATVALTRDPGDVDDFTVYYDHLANCTDDSSGLTADVSADPALVLNEIANPDSDAISASKGAFLQVASTNSDVTDHGEQLQITMSGHTVLLDYTVRSVAVPPVVTLTASESSVFEGEDVTLTWTVIGNSLSDCTAGGDWSGSKSAAGGSEDILSLTTDQTYTLACTGYGGTSDPATTSVTVLSKPNLVPTFSIDPSSTFDPVTGVYDSLSINYSIANNGDTGAGAFMNEFELDRDDDGSSDDTSIDTLSGVAAHSNSPTRSVLLASSVPFGDHRVYVRADQPGDVIDETDETDNEDDRLVTVPPPDPDMTLTVSDEYVRAGEDVTLSWNMVGVYPMDCSVFGPGMATHDFDPSVDGPSDFVTVSDLTAKSEFTFECTEPVTGVTFSQKKTVEVVGQQEEL